MDKTVLRQDGECDPRSLMHFLMCRRTPPADPAMCHPDWMGSGGKACQLAPRAQGPRRPSRCARNGGRMTRGRVKRQHTLIGGGKGGPSSSHSHGPGIAQASSPPSLSPTAQSCRPDPRIGEPGAVMCWPPLPPRFPPIFDAPVKDRSSRHSPIAAGDAGPHKRAPECRKRCSHGSCASTSASLH